MNIKMRYLAAIAAGVLLAASTVAADENKLALMGVGWQSCGKYLTTTKDDVSFDDVAFDFAYTSWTQGFLSGLNYDFILRSGTTTDLSDHQAQKIWIENYCKEYPLEKYLVAVVTLWVALRHQQGLESDERFIRKD